jgi:hypothetical protein
MPHIKEYATEAPVHTSVTGELHASLNKAIELAERVRAFRTIMLGAAPDEAEPKNGGGPMAVRSVIDELRDHIYKTNNILNDAMEALHAVERELS